MLVAGRIGFFHAEEVDRGQASEDLGKWHLHGPSDELTGGPSLRVTRLPCGSATRPTPTPNARSEDRIREQSGETKRQAAKKLKRIDRRSQV